MPAHRLSRGKFAKVTKLGAGLWRNRPVLEKIAVRNFLDLRKAVAANRLPDAGVGPDDLKEFASFASLARVFSSHVAFALVDQGADSPAALTRWNEDKFAKALAAAGIGKIQSATEQQRFARFRELARTNPHPESVTGLQIDLGEDYALLSRNASELTAGGVETIADWAHLRSGLKVDSGARLLLDKYARLSVFGLEPKTVRHLLGHNVDSAISLTHQTDSELQRIANSGGIPSTDLIHARQAAIDLTEQLIPNLEDDHLGDWDLDDVPDGFLDRPRPCIVCPENESVFSKFAYYLYLIDKTRKTFHELEISLFQDFLRMTSADGEDVVPQPIVCNEVLRGALGRDPSQNERLPETRYRVLSILRKVVPRSPAQIVSFWDARSPEPFPADLLPRLIAAYGAPAPLTDEEMLNPQPVFTRAEVNALGQVLQDIMGEEIQSDPAFVGATSQQVRDELDRRIAARAQDEIEFIHLIRRAALKKAINRTDQELFAQLFIETDLPLCERTTTLDQAIRTLQAYLTKNGTSTPRYLSFASWRGETLGKKYPETALLLRDDVLVGDTGTWDRGNILRNHAIQYAELKSQLSAVRRAIDDARVDISNDLDVVDWNKLNKFKDEPYYEYFQRGLAVIDDILDANDRIYRATGDLDHEEPGLALGRLQTAVSLLDRVDGELFDTDSFWANQDPAPKRYAELVKVNPATRRELLQGQFFNFARTSKRIFELLQPSPTFADDWSASPEFERGEGYIIRNETDTGTVSEFLYRQGRDLQNYTFSCQFRVLSQWSGGQLDPSIVGIGFRGQDGNSGRYRLAILRVYDAENPEYPSHRDTLALQRVSTGGIITTLSEHVIGGNRSDEFEDKSIQKDHWYGLTVTASGGVLSGSLRITPEKTIFLGPVQDPTFPKGTFCIFVRGNAKVKFRYLRPRSEGLTGATPFFAQIRVGLRSTLSDEPYWEHLEDAEPMSLELVTEPLAISIDTYQKRRLAGVKRNNDDLYLTFQPGGSRVSLGLLDELLERCLVLTYYLRFAAIPVRMAQGLSDAGRIPKRFRSPARALRRGTGRPARADHVSFFRLARVSKLR